MIIRRDHFNELREGYEILQTLDDKIVMAEVYNKGYRFHAGVPLFLKKKIGEHIHIGDVCFEPGVYVKKARKILKERLDKVTNRSELVLKHGYDCYSDDTEFLTEDGWKIYNDIKENELLATIHPHTKELEFQRFYERVKKPYRGLLYQLSGQYTGALVTNNHRMFVSPAHRSKKNNFSNKYKEEASNWQFQSLSNINKNRRSHFHVVTVPYNKNKDYPVSDEYLWLLGAFASEGTVSFRDSRVKEIRISQTDHGSKNFTKKMHNIGRKYNANFYSYYRKDRKLTEYIWVISNKNIRNRIYRDCGHLAKNKHLPKWIAKLSKRQAKITLEALRWGDGTENNKYSWTYYTKSKQLADDTQILALLAEKQSSLNHYNYTCSHVRIAKDSRHIQTVVINSKIKKTIRRPNEKEDDRGGRFIPYNGNIVCFSVPNETLITRRNGKIAIHGNTKFASHLIRLLTEGMSLLQEGELTFPLWNTNFILDIKHGKYTIEQIIQYADDLKAQLDKVLKASSLPATPYYKDIEELTIRLMKEHLST
jgi:hypothetical protein